jgi:hypothetical protein
MPHRKATNSSASWAGSSSISHGRSVSYVPADFIPWLTKLSSRSIFGVDNCAAARCAKSSISGDAALRRDRSPSAFDVILPDPIPKGAVPNQISAFGLRKLTGEKSLCHHGLREISG